jgi:hypothetical protein
MDPDTDKDGLLDGDEVDKWSTDPKNRDTDGDTWSDGKEVNEKTSPNNPDTDGDGLNDSIDPAPREPPTPTATPDLVGTQAVVDATATAIAQAATATAAAEQAAAAATATAQAATATAAAEQAAAAATATAQAATATAVFENSVSIDIQVAPAEITDIGSTKLTWNIGNAKQVLLDGAVVPAQGEETRRPKKTTTYTWTIVKLNDAQVTETRTVEVIALGSVIDHYVGTWLNDNRRPGQISYALTALQVSKDNATTATLRACHSASPTSPWSYDLKPDTVVADFENSRLVAEEPFVTASLKWTITALRSGSGLKAIVEQCPGPSGSGCRSETFLMERPQPSFPPFLVFPCTPPGEFVPID